MRIFMLTDFIKKNITNIKYIYTFIYLVFFSLTYNSVIDYYCDTFTSFLYGPLVFIGVVIMAIDFFFCGILLRFKYSWLLILFYISCLVSIFLNIAYDPVGNIKVIVWMLVQTLVIASVNYEYTESVYKKFRILIEVVAAVWFIGTVVSVVMFFTGYSHSFETDEYLSGYLRIGLYQARLFGVFDDPNYASLCVAFTALLIVSNMFMYKEGHILRIYHIILLVFDYLYIVLSASRTTEISVHIAAAVIGFFVFGRFLFKRGIKGLKKYVLSAVATILCVVVSFGVFFLVEKGAGELYVVTSSLLNEDDEGYDYKDDLIRPDVEYSNDVTNNRLSIWADYLKLSTYKPYFGTAPRNGLTYMEKIMPNSFVAVKQYSCHNGYLALLVGSGIVGFLIMAVFIVMNVKTLLLYLVRKNTSDDKNYLPIVIMSVVLVIACVGALPLMAIFFCNSAYEIIFWFTFGYVMSLVRISEPEIYSKEPVAYRLSKPLRLGEKK